MPGAAGQTYLGDNYTAIKTRTRGWDVSTAEVSAAIVQAMSLVNTLPHHQVHDMMVAKALEEILEELKQLNVNVTKAFGQ